MRRDLSVFLDLVRIVAACTVFLAHLSLPRFGGEVMIAPIFSLYAHSAVIVFFVLSGFLISLAAQRDGSMTEYLLNRASRIYSVALPAMLLTWAVDRFLIDNGTLGSTYQHNDPWKYLPLFLSFTNDFWFLSEDAFSNFPYWSLCYEVWYYIAFGILFFGSGPWRWGLAIGVLLLMGPRLWLLWPIWLAGAHLRKLPILSVTISRLILLTFCLGLIMLKATDFEITANNMINDWTSGFAKEHLRYSQDFLGDYLFAILIWGIIYAARGSNLTFLIYFRKPIAAMASISFSMYLTHIPLFLLFGALFPKQRATIGIFSLGGIVVFGVIFERNKIFLRRFFEAVLNYGRLICLR
jgi:peptidoglycan/LPS O-acetylase OafA/YrhL